MPPFMEESYVPCNRHFLVAPEFLGDCIEEAHQMARAPLRQPVRCLVAERCRNREATETNFGCSGSQTQTAHSVLGCFTRNPANKKSGSLKTYSLILGDSKADLLPLLIRFMAKSGATGGSFCQSRSCSSVRRTRQTNAVLASRPSAPLRSGDDSAALRSTSPQ